MTISLRLNEADTILFKKYAKMNGITLSELIRRSVIERIEEAMAEFKENPVTYSHEEVWAELNL